MSEENKEPKIVEIDGKKAIDVRGTEVGEKIEAIIGEEGPNAADLGAERPGMDDETFEVPANHQVDLPPVKPIDNPFRVNGTRVFGRNMKCLCGSDKKMKNCCWDKLSS